MKTRGLVISIVSLLVCLTGACLLAGAGGLFQLDANRRSTWVPVTGTVTAMREDESTDSSGSTSTVYCPTVAYASSDGQEHEADVNDCTSPPAYHTGDSVELLYDPQDPTHVEFKNGLSRTFTLGGLGALGVTGLACLLPGLLGLPVGLFLYFRRRSGPAAAP